MAVATTRKLILVSVSIALIRFDGQTSSFEVASVKPSTRDEREIAMKVYPGGRLQISNYTLKMLIQEAHSVELFQISGGAKWAGEERFSLVAKPPSSSTLSSFSPTDPELPPPHELRVMLGLLLADRFGLKVHNESTDGPVYLLEQDGKGLKLQQSKDLKQLPAVVTSWSPDSLQGSNASMGLLASRLAQLLRRPVLDHTDLSGAYDFKVEYVFRDTDGSVGQSLPNSLSKLGLKLNSTRGAVQSVVIDEAHRPTEN